VFLSEYVLGIRLASVAYKTFLFSPIRGFKTSWVHGRVPTPAGIIYAAWGYGTDGKIVMEVTAPPNITGTIVPPFNGTYTIDGRSGLSGNATVQGGGVSVILRQD